MAENANTEVVTLKLDTIDELFTAAPVDPFAGRVDDRPGVDRLRDQLAPGECPVELRLLIARGLRPEITESTVAAALERYCDAQHERLDVARHHVRRLGLKELAFGLTFLALCLSGSATLSALDVGPDWLRTFVVEGLVIVGWISLWHPIDMLFFERWPLVRDQRVLRRLRAARIRLIDPVREPHE